MSKTTPWVISFRLILKQAFVHTARGLVHCQFGSGYNLVLYVAVEFTEKGTEARYPDYKIPVEFRICLSLPKRFTVHHIELNVFAPVVEIGLD